MSYIPEWKGPIEGYVVNFLKKNHWRIANTHDHDDAMQEAQVCFLNCTARYPLLDTPQHFMALFKRTWGNHFIDLAYAATEARRAVPESYIDPEDGEEYRRDTVGDLDNEGTLAVMIRQAPREVLMVLTLFINAPTEILDLAMSAWRKSGRYRADGDRAVERMLGLPEGSDPVTKTYEYFTGGKR